MMNGESQVYIIAFILAAIVICIVTYLLIKASLKAGKKLEENQEQEQQKKQQDKTVWIEEALQTAPDYVKRVYSAINGNVYFKIGEIKKLCDEDCDEYVYGLRMYGKITAISGIINEVFFGKSRDRFEEANCIFLVYENYLLTPFFCLRLDTYSSHFTLQQENITVHGEKTERHQQQVTDSSNQKSVIGSAAAGGILFGGAGAVVGAIAAADHNARNPAETKTVTTFQTNQTEGNRNALVLTLQRRDGGCDQLQLDDVKFDSYASHNVESWKTQNDAAAIAERLRTAFPDTQTPAQ